MATVYEIRDMVEAGLMSPEAAGDLSGSREWARLPVELRDQVPVVENPLERYIEPRPSYALGQRVRVGFMPKHVYEVRDVHWSEEKGGGWVYFITERIAYGVQGSNMFMSERELSPLT